ncbi:hypothetical protein CPB83DRAFT_888015 [Crepidotus variabilis]|uniref:F-box domain-containing protein n=1 Tax=Crepidotus variabilis TaxID=179855 RepID=A0A9P6EUP1_9AGAR|nr:hypothetical protein CPB83DRAFT_888015 [Crepidotus variabilis]
MESVSLADLPPELQLRILEYLEPSDVFRLRRTCKALHHVSRERTLWISILCRLMDQNTIFEPSFSIPRMSLLQLEYAATSPDRWLRLVHRGGIQNGSEEPMLLRPCHSVVLEDEDEDEDEDEASHSSTSILQNILSLHLVLGGRYLITVSDLWLAVWDLEALGRVDLTNATPLAVTSAIFNRVLLAHRTPDKQGLRILLTSYGDTTYDFYIYEIYPQQKDPKLLKIAQCTVGNTGLGMSIYSMSKNYLLFLRHSSLNLWNFSIGKWCSMSIDWRHHQTIVTESTIAILYDDHVKVWSIPEERHFTRDFAQTSGTAPSFPPACTIQIPSSEDQGVQQCEGLCDWYSGTSQRQFFDYQYIDSQYFRRFELHIHGDLSHGEIIEHDIISNFHDNPWFEPGLVCNNHVVAYWMAENRIHVRTNIVSTGRREKIKTAAEHHEIHDRETMNSSPECNGSTFILLADDSLVEEGFYLCNFCPFSGRLVYVHESGKVMIFDFLSRPPLDDSISLVYLSPRLVNEDSSFHQTPKPANVSELNIKSARLRQLPLDSNDRRRLGSPNSEESTATT